MLQCRITGNNDGQKFVRTYYEDVVINRHEFRGAATPQHLAETFPGPDSLIQLSMITSGANFSPYGGIGFELAWMDGKEGSCSSITPVTLFPGGTAVLKIGELQFNVEVKVVSEQETGSDPDEGATLYQNSDILVIRLFNGIQVTHKGDPNCKIHITASNEFNNRLNVLPSVNTDVRVTNNKHRPMVQFLPDKRQ